MNYVKHQVNDDYEGCNVALQEELRSVSNIMMLDVLHSFITGITQLQVAGYQTHVHAAEMLIANMYRVGNQHAVQTGEEKQNPERRLIKTRHAVDQRH